MIREVHGDLKADADALVNAVNCAGVMGRGIALQFRKAWPENYKAYTRACERKEVQPGLYPPEGAPVGDQTARDSRQTCHSSRTIGQRATTDGDVNP